MTPVTTRTDVHSDVQRQTHLVRLTVAAALVSAALTSCSAETTSGGKPATTRSSSRTSSPGNATASAASAEPGQVATGLHLPGRIVFRRYADSSQTSASLFTSATDGTNERRLTPQRPGVDDEEPDWSPDGNHVLFTRSTDVGTDHETRSLMTVTADGSHPRYLTRGTPDHGTTVTGIDSVGVYSPDGSRIAYQHAQGKVTNDQLQHVDIWTMDADGNNRVNLTRSKPYSGDRGGVAWSPDGKRLAFTLFVSSTGKPAGGTALFVMNVDGSGIHRVTPWSLGAGGTPDWSTRDDTIAFRAAKDEEMGIGNFFSVHPDGSGLAQLTHFHDVVISHKVGFSTDGTCALRHVDAAGREWSRLGSTAVTRSVGLH